MIQPVRVPPDAPASTDDEMPAEELSDAVLRQLLPRLRRFALRLTRDAVAADDLVQSTLERALTRWRGRRPQGDVRAWLFTILYRARADQFRKAGRSPQTVALVDDGPAQPPPQDALARGQEDVRRALEQVPEAFRTAVLLRDLQELSYDEIASVLDIPIGTVMSRIHRGRALLRRHLQGAAA